MIGLTYSELKKLKPCESNFRAITKLLGGAKNWGGKKISAKQAVKAGLSFDDLDWVACAVAQTDKDVERRRRLWLADCAARALHIYEEFTPTDIYVRNAIIASRKLARGKIIEAAWAAEAASAVWTAWAAGASWAPEAAEEKWQFARLVNWLSDPEPSDYPLPVKLGGSV